jgi:lysozyme
MDLKKLVAELRRDEGVRYAPYDDTMGIQTVGVGHNMKCPLTDAQVDALLAADVDAVRKALDARLPWWSGLDDVRQRVLCNMAFNLGVAGLLGFKNTLAAVQAGRYADAAQGMATSAWARQVGARAARLVQAMRTGVMP